MTAPPAAGRARRKRERENKTLLGGPMEFTVDKDYLLETFTRLIGCDSPVGYYREMEPLMTSMIAELGHHAFRDRKHTVYVRVPGRDRSRTVCLGAHLDTIALAVCSVEEDGTLRGRHLGGVNFSSLEGTSCRVICRDGSKIDAVVEFDHHSPHVWTDAKKGRERDEDTMRIHLLEDVTCAEEARALGVTPGAVVAFEPELEIHDNGFVLSRFIDDKSCVAALLGLLKWFGDTGSTPNCDILLAFPFYEEVGWGGAYLPDDIEAYVALDIALMGPEHPGTEHDVAVIADDYHGPYDWDLTNAVVEAGRRAFGTAPELQNAKLYSTDAMGAFLTANDVAASAFGPLTRNTHGRELTHVDAMVKVQQLAASFVMHC